MTKGKRAAVKITFEGDQEAIDHFMRWLSNAGEQDYWNATEMVNRRTRYISDFGYDFRTNVLNCQVGIWPEDDSE